jgi:hypothetical protein
MGSRTILAMNGSLSVLKLMPGTYFSQTGKPLQEKGENIWLSLLHINLKTIDLFNPSPLKN